MNQQAASYSRTFSEVRRIVLPSSCLNKAYKQIRLAAMHGQEGLALLAGVEENNVFQITQAIIPRQVGLTQVEGRWSVVPAEELARIRAFLQDCSFELIAQIHSNPGQTDQAIPKAGWPLIQIIGGISIIVPGFALGPISPQTWAVYRLASDNKWIQLDQHEVCHLFEIRY